MIRSLISNKYFLTRAQFTAKQQAGTLEPGASYYITDEQYQVPLISGTNIKTINSNDILGSGNINIDTTSATWGNIDGTLSNQEDLNVALTALSNNKQDLIYSSNTITIDSEGHVSAVLNPTGGLQSGSQGISANIDNNTLKIVDNVLTADIECKQDKLTAGSNITFEEDSEGKLLINSRSYTSGSGINITIDSSGNGVVSTLPINWGDIQGTLSSQTDLSQALEGKQPTITNLSTIESGAALGATSLQPSALTPYRTSADQDTIDSGKASTNDVTSEAQARADADTDLQDQINNLKAIGRFLSTWNCVTGLPATNPTEYDSEGKYYYHTGDYFIVGTIAASGQTNKKPNGPFYQLNVASTTIETGSVSVNDYYMYDGTAWNLLSNTQKSVTFENITGQPSDNANLATALNAKQATLVSSGASQNIKTIGGQSPIGSGNIPCLTYTSGSGNPTSTDYTIGRVYFDTTNEKVWFATGTKWQLMNSWQ